jgi:hypothetical protein
MKLVFKRYSLCDIVSILESNVTLRFLSNISQTPECWRTQDMFLASLFLGKTTLFLQATERGN